MELGDKVKDKITGFEGIAVARTKWLTGCERITIEPMGLGEDGKVKKLETFDVERVEVCKGGEGAYKRLGPTPSKKRGGPRPDPVK